MPIITLLTDFGTQDYFVGAMKGVILSINPDAHIVDIAHDIPPQDIQSAAFNLLACYRDFPADAIHVAVVDPDVGSKRRALAIECANQIFVGPDNGIFSWICERERQYRAFSVTNEKLFRQPVSRTFHGRDVFAPVAATLSAGTRIEEVGERVTDEVQLPSLMPGSVNKETIEGRIIHIDHFGNLITNLTSEFLREDVFDLGAQIVVNEHEINSFRRYFADETNPGNVFCFFGSAGFLEIAAKNSSAQRILNAQRGQILRLNLPLVN
jgi:S-adenosyl-L-methionine hydrolase (adenosine-forming)